MPKEYVIQILDGETNQIKYFDRIKKYSTTHRVITSLTNMKIYSSRQSAEKDVELIKGYYYGQLSIEIVDKQLIKP